MPALKHSRSGVKKPSAKRHLLSVARLRLIPLTLTMLCLLLFLKLNDLYVESRTLNELLSTRNALAADAPSKEGETDKAKSEGNPDEKSAESKEGSKSEGKTEEKPAAEAGDIKTSDTKPAEAASGDKPAEGAPAAESDKEKPADDKKKEDKKEDKKKEEDEPKTFGAGKTSIKAIEELKSKQQVPQYSQSELDLLQNLVKRRQEIEKREQEFEVKSAVLDATQRRIDERIAEMKALQGELSKVVEQYNKHQDAEIRGLVKIYETMKPADAANIFNELDMPILLEVIDKMSERKVAPVLAGMTPKRARDVTQQLAEMRRGRVAAQKAAQAEAAPPPANAVAPAQPAQAPAK